MTPGLNRRMALRTAWPGLGRLGVLVALVALALAPLAACDPLISPYSAEAYGNATSLKARSLALMAKSGDAFAVHQDEVEVLLVDVDAAYEFAQGYPRNQLSAEQWAILRDPGGDLLGGFFRQWARDGTVDAFFRDEKRIQVAKAFDEIICLEVNKAGRTECLER